MRTGQGLQSLSWVFAKAPVAAGAFCMAKHTVAIRCGDRMNLDAALQDAPRGVATARRFAVSYRPQHLVFDSVVISLRPSRTPQASPGLSTGEAGACCTAGARGTHMSPPGRPLALVAARRDGATVRGCSANGCRSRWFGGTSEVEGARGRGGGRLRVLGSAQGPRESGGAEATHSWSPCARRSYVDVSCPGRTR